MKSIFSVLIFLTGPCAFAGAITCPASGTLDFYAASGGSADAFYIPSNGSLSQTAVDCLGPGAHFNWLQIVTQDPLPVKGASVPYVDPQPGGNAVQPGAWRDGFPWYYDEVGAGTTIGCGQNGVNTCMFYDPLAWQITSPCITYLQGQVCPLWNYIPSSDALAFGDTPQNPQSSIQLTFQTRLVIVSADESQWAYVDGFSWQWANPSPLLGTAFNFVRLTPAELVYPPVLRQGGGPPPPFLTNNLPHSSLGFPPDPLLMIATVPEPSSWAMCILAFGCIALFRLRGRKTARQAPHQAPL